jgi:polysaccharide biosynthesis protein PslG
MRRLQYSYRLAAFSLLATLSLSPRLSQAAPLSEGFENLRADQVALTGKSAEGSQVTVDLQSPHQGRQALRLNYSFTGKGFVGFNYKNPLPVEITGDTLRVKLWISGSNGSDFSRAALLLVDARGEIFQYFLPDLVPLLNNTGWQPVIATVDVSKPAGSWGQNVDKHLDGPFKLLGWAFDHGMENTSRGSIAIDDLSLSDATTQVPPQIEIVSSLKLPISGVQAPLDFTVKTSRLSPRSLLTWQASDINGTPLAQGTVPLAARDGEASTAIRVTPSQPGILYLRANILNDASEIQNTAQTRVAVFKAREKPLAFTPLMWGIASHSASYPLDVASREIAMMRAAGFTGCRFDMKWDMIQPDDGNGWKWDYFDALFAAFQREGVTPLPILDYSTRWASTADPSVTDRAVWKFSPPRTEAYARFVSEVVKRYGRYTKSWEIWNEPDSARFWKGTPEQFADLYSAATKAIHAVDPNAKVLNGGISEDPHGESFAPKFLKAVNPRPDIYAFHTHDEFSKLLKAADVNGKALRQAGLSELPIWLNEAGAATSSRSEREQAGLLIAKMAYSASLGYSGYVLYALRDDGTNPVDKEDNFGILKQDFAPKAAFVAVHNFLGQVEGQRFVRSLPWGEKRYALLFQGPDSQTLIYWQDDASLENVDQLLRTTANTLEHVDIIGNHRTMAVLDGAAKLQVSHEPQFLRLPRQAAVKE